MIKQGGVFDVLCPDCADILIVGYLCLQPGDLCRHIIDMSHDLPLCIGAQQAPDERRCLLGGEHGRGQQAKLEFRPGSVPTSRCALFSVGVPRTCLGMI